jgi:hypothetical protein
MENDFPDVRNAIKLLCGSPYGLYFGKQVKNNQLSHRNRMQKGLKRCTKKIHIRMIIN